MKVGDKFTRTGTAWDEGGTVYFQTCEVLKCGPKMALLRITSEFEVNGETVTRTHDDKAYRDKWVNDGPPLWFGYLRSQWVAAE